MTQQARAKSAIDTALAQEPASPFAGNSLLPMLIAGLVLSVAGMIAAALLS